MFATRSRKILAFLVLGAWAAVIAVHIEREYAKPMALRLEEGARAIGPGSHVYAVRMGDRTIGMASTRLDTVPGGFVLEDMLSLDVPALGRMHRAIATTRVELGRALELKRFRFALQSAVGRYEVTGYATPDSLLELEIGAGGAPERSRVRLDPDLTLDALFATRMAAAGQLQVGREVVGRLFDPAVMDVRETVVRVVGHDTILVPDSVTWDAGAERFVPARYDTVPAWRLEQRVGGLVVTSWVDEDGRLVRAESPLGLTLERTEFALARQDWRAAGADPALAAGYGAIIEATAIASDVALDSVEALDRLRVRLRGVGLEGLDLAGGRQTLVGDTLIVERETVLEAGYALPYRGGGEAAAELGATPLIQSDDPRIVRTARRIAGDETDPTAVARRLNDWVHARLAKDIVPSVPSAVQVLEARKGDCNEHTVLYVALARALGLPARPVAGLVHVQGRFYYHAWPEVWLGGRWVAVDPTLGQFPADASHLRMVVGGLARQVELVRLIGRLELEVL